MNQPINTGMSDYSLHRYWVAAECPQKYSYLYNLNLQTPPELRKDHFAFGTAVHFLLANHYAGNQEMDGVEGLEFDVKSQLYKAKELVDEYKLHYRNESVNVVAVETQIVINVGREKLSRRIDLAVERDGKLYVIDHKTAYNPRSRIREAVTDPSLYSQEIVVESSGFAERFGYEYGGFILNVIGKQPNSDGAHEFVREKLHWAQGWKDSFGQTMEHVLGLPRQFAHLDPWAWPRTGACVGRYGPCEFRDLCLYGRSVAGKYMA
jgi:hypothetical protein